MRVEQVKKSATRPAGLNFAVIGQIKLAGVRKDVIRLDNSTHQGRGETHIHFLDREKPKARNRVEYVADICDPWQAADHVEAYLRRHYAWLIEGEENAR